jgi:hypothetical protein
MAMFPTRWLCLCVAVGRAAAGFRGAVSFANQLEKELLRLLSLTNSLRWAKQ